MNSDQTFFTNEPGRSLRERFHALLGEHTRAFDCLVGYFYLSGFHQISAALEKVEKVRILIGLKTNQAVYDGLQTAAARQRQLDFVSHTEARERLPQEILAELDQSDDSPHIEAGLAQFIAWCQSGKLEIKVYPSEKIHAKVYVLTFVDGSFERGHVITGSSNLSQSGLQDNLEFNVELKTRADYEFALQKFNELWADAVEVSPLYVETIQRQSPFAQFEPYQLYLKFLYEYFKDELNQPEALADALLPDGFKKLRYQEDAVLIAQRTLDQYGGVFLSDVVGLGKTYMSALLAQQLTGRTLVIAPPALIDRDNPGSWPNVFSDFRIPQAEFESLGKLDDLLRRDISKFSTVFIDEAHRFRTETTGTYEKLAQICRGKRIVLVTATPLNNSPRDILSQLKLFQNGKNSTIPNVRNLEAFFSHLEKKLKGLDRKDDRDEYLRVVQENAREIREKVLKHVMVRRTRNEIANYYDTDLAAQNLKFPQVADPVPCFYQFSPQENAIFSNTIELLTQRFTYARYSPLTYYTGERSEQELTGQRNLARFMKVLLVKRLESSFHAFGLTLERFIRSYRLFIAAYHEGDVYLSKRHSARLFELLESGDEEAVEKLLEREQAERYDAASFLQQACAADPALQREVESLFAAEERAGSGFLNQPAMQEAARLLAEQATLPIDTTPFATTVAEAPPDVLAAGSLLAGRYQIERELGKGGIGVVFLARDRNLHDRLVVIKALLQKKLDAETRSLVEKKFRDEIKALALLEDPAIVRPLDAGQLADGQSYLVMEYVAGQQLLDLIPSGGMALPRIARLLQQIARAIDAAHSQGVIHRDLTPRNVMLSNPSTEAEQIKLIDFGLATVREALTASQPATTKVIGTPPYMAPEQLRGKPEKATDIYALGVLAYRMTTGQLPFAGEGFTEIAKAHRAGIQTQPCTLRPDLPLAAQNVILRALALEPRERYESATAFSAAFQQAVSETAPDPYQTTTGEALAAAAPSSHWWLSGGLLAALLLGVLAWRSWDFGERKAQPIPPAVVLPVAAERALSYALSAKQNPQRNAGSQPFTPSDKTVFEQGDLLRLSLHSVQPGYLYLISEARTRADQPAVFVALFPNARDNSGAARIETNQMLQLPPGDHWWDFSAKQEEEKLWLIWAEQPVPQLDTNPKDVSPIGSRHSAEVQRFLAAQAVTELKLAPNEAQPQLKLAGKEKVLVGLLKLPRR